MNNKILILKITCLTICSFLILAYFLPFSSSNLPDSEVTVSAFQATFGNRSIYGTSRGTIAHILYLFFPAALMGTFFLKYDGRYRISLILMAYSTLLVPSSKMFDMYKASAEIAAWIYLFGLSSLPVINFLYDSALNQVSQSHFSSATLDS